MAAKSKTEDYSEQTDFVQEHASRNKSGVHVLPRKAYEDLMAKSGVTPDVLKTVDDAECGLMAGVVNVLTTDLLKQIKDAKDAGEDTDRLKSEMHVTTRSGSMDVTVHGMRRGHQPRTGEPVTSYGRIDARINVKKRVPTEVFDKAREQIKKALGVNE